MVLLYFDSERLSQKLNQASNDFKLLSVCVKTSLTNETSIDKDVTQTTSQIHYLKKLESFTDIVQSQLEDFTGAWNSNKKKQVMSEMKFQHDDFITDDAEEEILEGKVEQGNLSTSNTTLIDDLESLQNDNSPFATDEISMHQEQQTKRALESLLQTILPIGSKFRENDTANRSILIGQNYRQIEEIKNEELVPNMREEDYQIEALTKLSTNDHNNPDIIVSVSLISERADYLTIVKKTENLKKRTTQHSIIVFERMSEKPVFTHELAPDWIPLELHSILINNKTEIVNGQNKLSILAKDQILTNKAKPELQLLLVYAVNNKVNLMVVFTKEKKWKNLLISTANPKDCKQYLTSRSFFSKTDSTDEQPAKGFDLVFHTGALKMLHLSSDGLDAAWPNKIREKHFIFTLNNDSSLPSDLISMKFDLASNYQGNSAVAFLTRLGCWASIKFFAIESRESNHTATLMKTINIFEGQVTSIKSLAFSSNINRLLLFSLKSKTTKLNKLSPQISLTIENADLKELLKTGEGSENDFEETPCVLSSQSVPLDVQSKLLSNALMNQQEESIDQADFTKTFIDMINIAAVSHTKVAKICQTTKKSSADVAKLENFSVAVHVQREKQLVNIIASRRNFIVESLAISSTPAAICSCDQYDSNEKVKQMTLMDEKCEISRAKIKIDREILSKG